MSTKQLEFSPDLSLPLNAATQTFAFIARKGAGKTYAAGKLTEELLAAGVQVVILDTVGNWYGLRLAADGKGKGFDVPVFGGLRADLPLEASAGELVADVVVDTGRSLILDVSQFSLGDRKRFAVSFGERLWKRKKGESHPTPLMLVIEESQLIVPQFAGRGGDDGRMVGIYEEIIRLGRNYGIGCMMISQRPQSVNKEVLNQTECLCVLQTNGAQERKALKEWIVHQGMDIGLLDELPSLPVGTAYVWSPQWLGILQKVRIGKKRTFDASSTPKVGGHTVRRDPAPLDLAEIEGKMKAAVDRARENDPKLLKAELARTKAELIKAQAQAAKPVPPPEVKETRVEKPVLTEHQLSRIEKLGQTLDGLLSGFAAQVAHLRDAASKIGHPHAPMAPRSQVDGFGGLAGTINWTAPRNLQPRPRPPTAERQPRPLAEGNGHLPDGERRILTLIAQRPNGAERDTITVNCGYKRSSRDTYLQRLRSKGFVDQRGESILITAEGLAALGEFEPLPSGIALQEHWRGLLPEGERRIFDVVLGAYPNAVPRDFISEQTNYQRSSRDTYLQRLSQRRLVESIGRGEVKASDDLF